MEKSQYMKIFVYGFVWKSTKQLQSASKQRKVLNWEHCIVQVILDNLHQFLLVVGLSQCETWSKQMSVTGNALVGFLSVVGASKLLRFGGQPLELDGLTLVARIIPYDSSRLNWRKDFWSLGAFPFWQKWRRYRIQALIFAISIRCQSGHGKYFLTFFFQHHLSKSPSVQSPSFNSEKVWCQINHPIINPLRTFL